ncbi:MAG: hypothetical protein K6G50_00835 [bacterium]|nr:hypothetical protein [bacterium]
MAKNKVINNETETPPSGEDSGINVPGNNIEDSDPSDITSENDEKKDNDRGSKNNIDWTTIALLLIVIVNIAIYLHSVNRSEDSREDEQLASNPPAQTQSASPAPKSSGQGAADTSKPAPGSGGKGSADASKPAPGSGNDDALPGSGNNSVIPGSGNDNVLPGSGNDSFVPGSGNDSFVPGSGNDKVPPGSGNDNVSPGSGNDAVFPGSGNDNVSPGSGNDNVVPGSGNDDVLPGSGNDDVTPGSGNRRVYAGSGDESVIPGSYESNAIDGLLSQYAPGPDPAPMKNRSYLNRGEPFPHPKDLATMLSTDKGQKALAAMQKEKGDIKLTDEQKMRIDAVLAYQQQYRELGAGVVAITAILDNDQLAYLRNNKKKLTDPKLNRGNPIAKAIASIKLKASTGVPRAVVRPSTAPEFNPKTISVGIILLEQTNLALDNNQAASITKYLEVMDRVNSSIKETLDDIINKKQRAYLEAELNMREKGKNAHL